MASLEEMFAQVDAQHDEIVELEQALVRIPSVNSGFMPTGGRNAGVRVHTRLAR